LGIFILVYSGFKMVILFGIILALSNIMLLEYVHQSTFPHAGIK
jgi:hypothetical protein